MLINKTIQELLLTVDMQQVLPADRLAVLAVIQEKAVNIEINMHFISALYLDAKVADTAMERIEEITHSACVVVEDLQAVEKGN